MTCEDFVRKGKNFYACPHHKLIWKREPYKCRGCGLLQNYLENELTDLFKQGYRFAYPRYHA